jgi:hypothetical protein
MVRLRGFSETQTANLKFLVETARKELQGKNGKEDITDKFSKKSQTP